jgi:hypothetical protein
VVVGDLDDVVRSAVGLGAKATGLRGVFVVEPAVTSRKRPWRPSD